MVEAEFFSPMAASVARRGRGRERDEGCAPQRAFFWAVSSIAVERFAAAIRMFSGHDFR